MHGDDEEKITIDRKTFKTLASDTRIGILKSLQERRKMLSELAKENRMSASTIKEHLDNLVDAELIVRRDDGHKWKYYELTRKGKAVLNPEEKKIWVLLSLSGLAILATAFDALTGSISNTFSSFTFNSEEQMMLRTGVNDMVTAPAPEMLKESAGAASEMAVDAAQALPWTHIILIAILAIIACFLGYKLWKSRKKTSR